jgi:hypothetical protein
MIAEDFIVELGAVFDKNFDVVIDIRNIYPLCAWMLCWDIGF